MQNRKSLAVALAVALGTTSCFVNLSAAQSAGQAADRTSPQTGQSGGSSTGSGASGRDAQATTGGDAERQMAQTLQQIAQTPESAPDKLFVLMAATGNMWETEFSRVVQEKVQDQDIKDLAKMIQQDHAQAQQQLQQVAQELQLTLPSSLPAEKMQKLQIFRAMSPEQLKTCFIVDLKADHAKDITSFADHQQTLKNERVKQYIAQTLPKLQQHGGHIQQVASAHQIGSDSPMLGNSDQGQNRTLDRSRNGNGQSGSGGTSGASGSGGTGTGGSGSNSGNDTPR